MLKKSLFILILLAAAGSAGAKDNLPAVSHDGLKLVPNTKMNAVYMKPGADLSVYNKVTILDVYVAFRKNWKRDHNEQENFEERVSDKDIEDIRERIATGFKKEFEKVLSKEGGHEVVESAGEGVLILRPAIVNLDISAPDLMKPDIQTTYTASAGSMTLYMELYDGKTQAILARIIDSEAADNVGLAQIANRVTNTAAFDRVVRRWAESLNNHLEQLQ